ncbi:MAG: putative peptidyl-prolyl cis-trans isomerase [Pelotomaculum sp. PtaB.Bin104]|nr:MAG: putative peptidyl-prolyl cis-trans isomerase [Pelotomaculum sp. PtaB.Bin104]
MSKKRSKNTPKKQSSISAGKVIKLIIGIGIACLIVYAVTMTNGTKKSGVDASKMFTIQTAQGPVVLEVYPQQMPVTVENFEKLVSSNFYNGLTFHRVEDWVVQGGDPKGNGTGGPGWTIPLETSPELKNVRGAVAMARSKDPNSAGSQFYILKKDAAWLDGDYAVFGKVIQGMEIVDQIKPGDKMESVTVNK